MDFILIINNHFAFNILYIICLFKTLPARCKYKKGGFALVELSIVLVIIGLLIGGILVGQSMIESVKINGVIRQLSQYDIAISNFRTKYDSLPGDSAAVCGPLYTGIGCSGGSGYKGDNDGVISFFETRNVWPLLSQILDINNYQGNNFTNGIEPYTKTSCPIFNINQSQQGAPPCLFVTSSILYPKPIKNYYLYFAPLSATWGNSSPYDSLYAKDLLSLDQKIDDGLPASGMVLGIKLGYLTGSGNSAQCALGGAYNTSTTNYTCSLYVDLGFTGSGQ